ncbi:hypothetical protein EON65_28375 [archaeon]|nr:MAG: hypothetical protein EON65_28375 [archaeon]
MSDPSDQKPRRLEDTTAAYLADIEIQYNELCKKLNSEETAENKSILVNNVFQEIHTRTASAACDRRTNYILEQLCFEADFSMTVSLLESWIVYAVFLARNRYGSHVVQVLILYIKLSML